MNLRITAMILALLCVVLSCKKDPKNQTGDPAEEEVLTENEETTTAESDVLNRVIDAHGGKARWDEFKAVYFEIERSDYQEKYDVNLDNRDVRIEYKDHVIGKMDETIWIKNLGDEDFKGDAEYLHNFMYYIRLMPFILADDMLSASEVNPLNYEDISYPGVMVRPDPQLSGKTKDDEYIIYYNPNNFQMEWLAYKVNFYNNTNEDLYTLIKYHDWEQVDSLLMPSVVQWHIFEKGEVKDQISEMFYRNTSFKTKAPDGALFSKPEDALLPSEIKK